LQIFFVDISQYYASNSNTIYSVLYISGLFNLETEFSFIFSGLPFICFSWCICFLQLIWINLHLVAIQFIIFFLLLIYPNVVIVTPITNLFGPFYFWFVYFRKLFAFTSFYLKAYHYSRLHLIFRHFLWLRDTHHRHK